MKQRKKFMVLMLMGIFLSACAQDLPASPGNGGTTVPSAAASQGAETGAGSMAQALPPVERQAANTDFAAAWPGQTRAPGLKTRAGYGYRVLARGLQEPWSVKQLPDGRFLVTQKAGTLRIVTQEGGLSRPIGGFPALDSSGQGGLLDVLPAKDFSASRLLYFTLAEKTDQGSLTAVGRGRLSEDESRMEDFSILFRAMPYYTGNNHYGSRLVWDRDGHLMVSSGERQSAQVRSMAQSLDNGLGKMFRITAEGAPAPGNPFLADPLALPEIYSYGHRNVQGLAVHPASGEIWIAEMGPQGGDELNLVEAGKNYGWPVISYGEEYGGAPIGQGIALQAGMEQPVYYWDPVVAPSGMTFYDSDVIPEWQNDLFIGALRGRHIVRLKLEGQKVVGEEPLLSAEGERFRDITLGQDGALYAVTDSGKLYRIGL